MHLRPARVPIAAISFLASVGLTFVSGCGNRGPRTYPVSGSVSFDGEPIATGDVMFVPVDSSLGPHAGKIHDGKYRLDSVAGPQRVEIRALRPIPGAAAVLGEFPQENFLPARYHADSTLKADVTPTGPNEVNFALESDRP